MKKRVAIIAVALVVAGCATTKAMQAVGGSRSDGIVRLGFDYGMFESPKVDMEQARLTAEKRCQVWGYESAEPFDAATEQCISYSGYGCARTRVTMEYQCVGANKP